MNFIKGMPRYPGAGRKKGTPNKKKVAKVADYLSQENINPAEEILKLIKSGALEPRDELKAWSELLSYTQAKPPVDDFNDDDDDPETDPLEKLRDVTDETLILIINKEKATA